MPKYQVVKDSKAVSWFVKTVHEPHRYVNELLYSRIVPTVYLEHTYRVRIPRCKVLELKGQQHIGVEYIPDIIFSLEDEIRNGHEPSLIPRHTIAAMALLDITLYNCDRTPINVVWSDSFRGSSGYVFIDHEHALLGDGASDLIRFRRPRQLHPHADYIRHSIFEIHPGDLKDPNKLLQALLDSFRSNLDGAVSELMDTGLISRAAVEALQELPFWWVEVGRRVRNGEIFARESAL